MFSWALSPKILIFFGLVFVAVDTTPITYPVNFNQSISSQSKFPWDDDDSEVQFLLFTSNSALDEPIISKIDDEGILFNGTFDSSKMTKIVIHGWMDNWKKEFCQSMIKAYLPCQDYNVVVVDWKEADNVVYPWCRYKVPVVGKIVAKFLDRLRSEYGFDAAKSHLIGHSLGAHVAAVAGRNLEGGKIGRITGLDPAFPFFVLSGDDTLRADAAKFVDVVHTAGGVVSFYSPLGHVDFYPNGGIPSQPGCGFDLTCSHIRSFKLYAESIVNSTSFLGTQCTGWIDYTDGKCNGNEKLYMNDDVDQSSRGIYFLRTTGYPPYGLGPNS
ncbi:phosphatidylcholine 1-acylhydrolase activity [Nesidiocoris tenuis]|uniref:Phosphatidylcholine 1-acylhydrolase activity n=1 Tax=Nesidiocoris tenuis TaxID=355587 RepID=A0ABN7AR24_9HEMI|nr:phosphatidylcholine 1-acylhydrolase activity [Nesidiocoris tenuis]